jgi:hypothetical protein
MAPEATGGSTNFAITNSTIGNAFYINYEGNVGIGLTSPSHKIDVSDSSTTWAGKILNTNLRGYGLLVRSDSTTASDLIFGAYGNGGAGAGYKMAIQAGGNVGIGTTSPSSKLTVVDNSNILSFNEHGSSAVAELKLIGDTAHDTAIYFGDAADNVRAGFYYDVSANQLQVRGYNNSTRMAVTSNGDVGIGTTSPASTLHVDEPSTSANSLTYGAAAGQIFTNENSEFAFGLLNASPYPLYIQGRTNANTAKNITLQGLGGNIGIGTYSPSQKLSVNGGKLLVQDVHSSGDTPPALTLGQLNNQYQSGIQSNGHLTFKVVGSGGWYWYDDANIRMYLSNAGNLGIGTTSASQKLTVNSGTTNSVARFESTNDTAQIIIKDDDTTMYFGAKNNVGYISSAGSGPSQGICVNTSGNVGIGTATPSSLLHLSDASSPTIRIVDTTNSVTLLAFAQDSSAGFGTYSNHTLAFFSNSAERMRISTGGNVGIGTTSPSAKLHVNGTAKATKLELDESGSSTGDLSSAAGFIDVIVNGTGYIIPYFSPD